MSLSGGAQFPDGGLGLSGGALLPDGRLTLTPRVGSGAGGSVVARGGSVAPKGRPTSNDGGPGARFTDPFSGREFVWSVPRPVDPRGACRRVTMMELGGSETYTVPPKGINYIFVQGKESACFVTCDMDKDKDRRTTCSKMSLNFTALADVKHLMVDHSGPLDLEPRIVVNVLCNGDKLNKEKGSMPGSDHEVVKDVDELAAIRILRERLKDGSTDTYTGTIQVAISALQCMYSKELEANEFEVLAVGAGDRTLLTREEIARHLAVINDSSGSSGELV